MHGDAAVNTFVDFASRKPRVEQVPIREKSQSDTAYAGEELMTKAEEADQRESIHALMLGVTQLVRVQADKGQAEVAPKSNANRNTIIAALLIAFIPQAFNVVWYTRGTERDTARDLQNLQGTVKTLDDRVSQQATWEEKLRNNLAAYGWLIDRDGNVSRIDDGKPRRKP